MKKVIIYIFICILIIFIYFYVINKNTNNEDHIEVIKLEQPEFLEESLSDSILLKALIYYDIKEPIIVLAQAKLESSNYKSRLCREQNNLFGLYNSRKKKYFEFEHWSDCIIGYKNMIEYKHNDNEDYYNFLERINYAEDPEYIYKVKTIAKKIPP